MCSLVCNDCRQTGSAGNTMNKHPHSSSNSIWDSSRIHEAGVAAQTLHGGVPEAKVVLDCQAILHHPCEPACPAMRSKNGVRWVQTLMMSCYFIGGSYQTVQHACQLSTDCCFCFCCCVCRFITCFVTMFATVIAITKDLPDIEGDKANNISTFATRLGVKNVSLLGELVLCVVCHCCLFACNLETLP